MIQPSECLHDRLDHEGRCGDCGTMVRVTPRLRALRKAIKKEIEHAEQPPDDGYGYAYGKGWPKPPEHPQKGR